MTSIAIITARGGSKRIPRKNIKDFCGKPIIGYSIEAAKRSRLFDEVMVSTDDKEIAEIAEHYGASVPFMRSAKNSDDFATTADVLREVLTEYEKRGYFFEWMCCLYPTAPFVTSEKLRDSFSYLQKSNADALVSVVRFSFPPQRCFVFRDGLLSYKCPENAQTRSQDLEPLYHDAGQFYFWKVDKFANGMIKKTIPFILSDLEVQDIDNLSDWKLAELKYRVLLQERACDSDNIFFADINDS